MAMGNIIIVYFFHRLDKGVHTQSIIHIIYEVLLRGLLKHFGNMLYTPEAMLRILSHFPQPITCQ